MRPPETSQSSIELPLNIGAICIECLKGNDLGWKALGSRNRKDFFIDVGGENLAGDAGGNLRPIASATCNFKNTTTSQFALQIIRSQTKVGLSLWFMIDSLVFI